MSKYNEDIKIAICKEYLEGTYSRKELCEKCGIHFCGTSILDDWIMRFQDSWTSVKLHNLLRIEWFIDRILVHSGFII